MWLEDSIGWDITILWLRKNTTTWIKYLSKDLRPFLCLCIISVSDCWSFWANGVINLLSILYVTIQEVNCWEKKSSRIIAQKMTWWLQWSVVWFLAVWTSEYKCCYAKCSDQFRGFNKTNATFTFRGVTCKLKTMRAD